MTLMCTDTAGSLQKNRTKKEKICIFGGTFHPIHNGHLQMAYAAEKAFGLDRVIFVPTGHAPHKSFSGDDMTPHRCNMVSLAIRSESNFRLSLWEVNRSEVNYTYQTLQHFHQEYPNAELFFLLGADSLFDFPQWKCPSLIAAEATILVAVRDDWDEQKVAGQIAFLKEQYGGTYLCIPMQACNVSSHEIRQLAAEGKPFDFLVPASVAAYIRENHLYL